MHRTDADELDNSLHDFAYRAAAESQPAPATPDAAMVVRKHRRQIELSPGVGADVQRYGLAVCDDILADLPAPATVTPDQHEDVRMDVMIATLKAISVRILNGTVGMESANELRAVAKVLAHREARLSAIVQNWFARLPQNKSGSRKELHFGDCEDLLAALLVDEDAT